MQIANVKVQIIAVEAPKFRLMASNVPIQFYQGTIYAKRIIILLLIPLFFIFL